MNRPALLVLAALAFALPARAARADEDAGTRSVFAQGAGSRALAMGGAFVATADDASAMIWNPAGLGLVQQSELQAGQSASLGLGFHESYASLVLPSWRWGAAGVSLRYFGVEDIEERGERNELLGSNFSDTEVEIALGYGRRLGEAWNLGAALKLQRQSLAGLTGAGVGLDLGLGVRPALALGGPEWANPLSVGLALRNAIEPSLRLDQDNVSDPVSVRAGLAYRAPMGSLGGVLVGVDVEKSPAMSSRLHAGLEFRFRPAAALRVGSNGGLLTAGTGIQWRQLSLDYAFEDNPIAPSHRVGLSFLFGATLEERRTNARRVEDAAVEQRLTDAFRQRQDAQIDGLLERAEQARAHGDYDEALEALSLVTTLAPGESRASALEVACWKSKAAELERSESYAAAAVAYGRAAALAPGDSAAVALAARCRSESDRRAARSSLLRDRFARAMDAFGAEDLAAARAGFAEVVKQEPRDGDAAEMLRRTQQAIARRVGRLVDQAGASIRSGSLSEAAVSIEQIRALDPDHPSLLGIQSALARARRSADASRNSSGPSAAAVHSRSAPGGPPAGPRLSDREVEDLYRRGLAAVQEHRLDDALRYWELVWSARGGYREVREYLKREYLTRGMDAFAAGRVEEAVAQWRRVLEVDPGDGRARGYLERAQKQIARSREILEEER